MMCGFTFELLPRRRGYFSCAFGAQLTLRFKLGYPKVYVVGPTFLSGAGQESPTYQTIIGRVVHT